MEAEIQHGLQANLRKRWVRKLRTYEILQMDQYTSGIDSALIWMGGQNYDFITWFEDMYSINRCWRGRGDKAPFTPLRNQYSHKLIFYDVDVLILLASPGLSQLTPWQFCRIYPLYTCVFLTNTNEDSLDTYSHSSELLESCCFWREQHFHGKQGPLRKHACCIRMSDLRM